MLSPICLFKTYVLLQVYLQRVAELDKVTEKRDKYRGMHDQLRRNRLNEFSQGFS